MTLNFSKSMTVILRKCEDRTRALKRFVIEPEDIIHSILSEDYSETVKYIIHSTVLHTRESLLVIRDAFKKNILEKSEVSGHLIIFDIAESQETKKLYIEARKVSAEMHSRYIEPEHIIIAVFSENTDKRLRKPFLDAGFVFKNFVQTIKKQTLLNNQNVDERIEIADTESETPIADYLCKDLTKLAMEDALDTAFNRDDEIERIIQILGRRKKNNPILIGKPGVGKTAIVEAIAKKMIAREIPVVLKNKRLLSLDMGMMVAGTKYRGQFEERMKNFIKELENHNDIILFIDELHNIVGTGSAEGSMDASNMLKPQLSRGDIQCIGATTLKEYRKYIEKDGALERRFQQVMIKEMDEDSTIDILKRIKHKYEHYHNVKYSEDAIINAVLLSQMYITERVLPDKAIDVIDEAGSKMNIQMSQKNMKATEKLKNELKTVIGKKEYYASLGKYKEAGEKRDAQIELEKQIKELDQSKTKDSQIMTVDTDIIKEVIALWTGIPINKLSTNANKDIIHIEKKLNEDIVGQEHVVKTISSALKLSLLGLKDNLKPQIVFMFIGPSGVGKTFVAKKIAEYVYDKPDSFMRFDMSEYSLEHEVEKLIGSPPGYIGYEEGGRLTEFVRRNPYSLLLFDEIEKAHPNIYNLFLQILDEGTLNDSFHRKINFKNNIIIFTSNIGTYKKGESKSIGFNPNETEYDEIARKRFLDETKKNFRPEFLNRLDNIIVFNRLNISKIAQIFDIHLHNIADKYSKKGFPIIFGKGIPTFLAKQNYNSEYGARAVDRSIEGNIENKITEEILHDRFPKGRTICFSVKNDEINFEFRELETVKLQEEH